MDEVIAFINSQKSWKIAYISEKTGFSKQGKGVPSTVVGVKSIRTEIGEYRDPQFGFIFITSVTVFWGFDENSKLIDIYVWKTTDAL